MSTQQDIYAVGSENHPPMLNKENYVPWSSCLLRYAKSRPNGKLIHNSIINGPYVRRMIPELSDPNREVLVNETFHVQTDDELTKKVFKQIEVDDQAIQTILLGLPEEIYAAVDSCETAQEIWNLNGYNDVQNVENQVIQNAVQNPNRNGNLVAARAEGNATRHNGNQIRCYNYIGLGHFSRNCTVRPRGMDVAYFQTQLLIAQKEEAGIQLQAKEFDLMAAAVDLDEIEEVHANCILMANTQQASTSGTQTDKAPVYDSDGSAEYTELLEPIPEPHQVPQNDNNVISEVSSVEQSRGTVKQHPANVEETRVLYDSLYNNLVIEVEKVNTVNRKLSKTNVELTTELARYKNQERCFEISQEKYNKLERCYQKSIYQEQCLSKKINALHLSFDKQIMTLNEEFSDLNKQLSMEKSTVSSLLEEKKTLKSDFKIRKDKLLDKQIQLEKKIKELDNVLVKTGQSIQTIHMLSPKPDSFYHTEQKMALADESIAKHKALELEIKRLLRAAVSQDIMFVVQKNSVVDTSNLQTELEPYNDMQQKIERLQAQLGDLKGKSKDTSCVSDTLDTLSQKLENENVELEFQVSDQKDTTRGTRANTKFEKGRHTKTRRPQPRSNTKNDRVPSMSKSSQSKNKEFKVEEHHRKLLFSRNKKHMSSECNNFKLATQNVKSKVVCATFKQCLIYVNHDVCLLHYLNGMNSRGKKQKANVSINENQKKQKPMVKKTKKVGSIKRLASPKPTKPRSVLRWSPTGRFFDLKGNIIVIQICLWCVDSSCSKHMTRNLNLLINFVWKFLGTVRFENDHIAAIMGFGDLQWGNILITRVYFIEGLGHNLFSVRQFYDSELEVAFRRNTSFVRNLEGVNLLKGNRTTNLYTINFHEMASASPICLMARASSTKSCLWHQRLSHLNFDIINDLSKNNLVTGLPKFKYHKEHLCPSCEQGKNKRASHPPKPVPNSK
nr:retrovirus-related Pol polyprotein from transposon TNT 1-94 [Tanacetum cinerariifolium]